MNFEVARLTSLQKLETVRDAGLVACEHEASVELGCFGLVVSDFWAIRNTAAHDVVHISVADDASRLDLTHVGGEWAVLVVVSGVVELILSGGVGLVRVGVQLNGGTYRSVSVSWNEK